MNSKDWLFIIFVGLVHIVLRFIYPFKNVASDNYRFIDSSVPYFFQPDSYHYYKILIEYGLSLSQIYILPILITIITITLFYICLRKLGCDEKWSGLGTILLSVSPYFFMATYFGYVDTPPYILCIFVVLELLLILSFKNKYFSDTTKGLAMFLPIYAMITLLRGFWDGWFIVAAMIGIGILFYSKYSFRMWILPSLILGGVVFYNFGKILLEYFSLRGYITELSGADLPVYFILIGLATVCLIPIGKKEWFGIETVLQIQTILLVILGVLFKRFAYLSMIPMILLIFYNSKNTVGMKWFVYLIILISVVNVHQIFDEQVPLMTRDIQAQLEMVDGNIVNSWEYGHYINAFAKSETKHVGHPKLANVQRWDEGLYDQINTSPKYTIVKFVNKKIIIKEIG